MVKFQHAEGSVSKYSVALRSASLTDLGTKDSIWRPLVSPRLNPSLPAQEVRLDIAQVCKMKRGVCVLNEKEACMCVVHVCLCDEVDLFAHV